MKTNIPRLILVLAAATLGLGALAQEQNDPTERNNTPATQNSGSETNADDSQEMVGELIQAVVEAQQGLNGEAGNTNRSSDLRSPRPIRGQGTRGTAGSSTNAISLTTFLARQSTNGNGNGAAAAPALRLNFRNAPLSLVLDYLSEAAGFTISANSKVDLKGAVTVWANQPVSRLEAVQVLHKALGEHNYAATVDGNVLNIYVVDSSNTDIVAGVPNNDYTTIPPTRDLVTQIVYVHNVEAGQLISTLQPLMPNGTSMTANQGANAIVITDTKANIRRMVQLVKALDTASVSASALEVFPLQYADATTLATVVQQLFQQDSSSSQGGNRRFGGFPGFPGFGGDRGGRGGDSGGSAQAGRMAAAKVVAVADDRSNSLVVSASEDQMALVRQLVNQMDVNVDDITELRVFRLKYADPQETADQLTSLFPDTTQQSSGNRGFRGGFMFGGGPPGFNPGGNTGTTDRNSRKALQIRVTAVADPRTGSVIVSAARDLMPQIASIIEELDSDPAKKKKVYVIKVENRDPQEVVEELQGVIATDTSSGNFNSSRSSQQTGTQLSNRQQNNLRNTGNRNNSSISGFGNNTSRTGR